MSQPTLPQVLAAARKTTAVASQSKQQSGAPVSYSGTGARSGAGGSQQHGAQLMDVAIAQVPTTAPAAGGSSGPCSREGLSQQPCQQRTGRMKPGETSKQQFTSNRTQLFLDLGQSDFNASRCSVCGMVYAKGHEEDEKLHKAYHQGALNGFKFQGWPQERVLLSEVAQGRLLLVLQTDPANHVKKARELCAFVEKGHGLCPGWLLSEPQARVLLYVSSQRRVVGIAVVEPLRQAYRLAASSDPQGHEVDSQQAKTGHQQPPEQQQQDVGRPHCQQDQPQQSHKRQQQQQLVWPGLQKRGRLAALGRAAGSGGNVLLSNPSLCGSSFGPSCNTKADSCPTSLLAAAERLNVQVKAGAGLQATIPEVSAATGAADGTSCAEAHPAAAAAAAADSIVAQDGVLLDLPQQARQQQQQGPCRQQPQQLTQGALMPSKHQHAPHQQQYMLPWQQGLAASILSQDDKSAAVTRADTVCVGVAGRGGVSATQQQSSIRHSQKPAVGSELCRVGAAGSRVGANTGCRSLFIDRRRPERALVGVRMVWVSPEQRRRGLATKLLDAARCNLLPGYVVPCSQVAFSQPTGEGVALASAFAGTPQFLVYGVE